MSKLSYIIATAAVGSVLMLGTGCAANNGSSAGDASAQPAASAQASAGTAKVALKDGTYKAEANGKNGLVKTTATIEGGKIVKISTEDTETQGLGDKAMKQIEEAVIKDQSLGVDTVAGATFSSNALLTGLADIVKQAGADPAAMGFKGVKAAATQAKLDPAQPFPWDAAPKEGLIKGDYYRAEQRFRQGHMGILEVVVNNDKIQQVVFNETARPNYYLRFYQNQNKRLSEYNQTMKDKKGAAWIESVLLVEKQMVDGQRLTGEFDTVAGASNSVQQSMLPLAEKISGEVVPSAQFKGPKLYQVTKKMEDDGMIAVLKLVVDGGKIVDLHYDEVFPADPKDIKVDANKKYHGLSKYDSIMYEEPSRIGFNVAMDALRDKVLETQNLEDLTDLPAIEDSGDYKKAGYTKRNTAWNHYLELAAQLKGEMQKDGVLS